jgi:hypothetical protein
MTVHAVLQLYRSNESSLVLEKDLNAEMKIELHMAFDTFRPCNKIHCVISKHIDGVYEFGTHMRCSGNTKFLAMSFKSRKKFKYLRFPSAIWRTTVNCALDPPQLLWLPETTNSEIAA